MRLRVTVKMLLATTLTLAWVDTLVAGELDGLRAGHPRLFVTDHVVWKRVVGAC